MAKQLNWESVNQVIFTDGACSGNPGPGGWGALVFTKDTSWKVRELGGAHKATTNNEMELLALIESLKQMDPLLDVHVYLDSSYVIYGATQWRLGWMKRDWKTMNGDPVANRPHWEKLSEILEKYKKVHYHYVPGHQGIPGNERCDKIAVALSKSEPVELYQGEVSDYPFAFVELPHHFPLPEMNFGNKQVKTKSVYYLSYVDGKLCQHNSWKECETLVKGRSGAKFKKIENEQQRTEILSQWGVKES